MGHLRRLRRPRDDNPGQNAIMEVENPASVSCEICHTRKEKRFCPAVHGRICSTCCGTEREVTLDCPLDCPYLQQAHRNEKLRTVEEVGREALMTEVEIPEQFVYDREPLILGLGYTIAQAAHADRSLQDREAIAALTALAKGLQTRVESGLVYEERSASLPQQALVDQLRKMLDQYREVEVKNQGYSSLRDSDALQAVVFLMRLGLMHTNGRPKSRAFLDFLLRQFPEQKSAIAAPGEARQIVMP